MGEEEVVSTSAALPDIAADGDVVFLVGADKARLRVYSLILKNTSKVFSAMLGPQFSEGQALLIRTTNTQPVELPLPEDDPDALRAICNILHGRNDAFVEPVRAPEILNIAIAADKWDCVVPLAWAVKDWLRCEGVTDSKELWRLMLAAYWFDEDKAFEKITQALLFHHKSSYFDLKEQADELDSNVFMRIRNLLEESRTNLRMNLLQNLFHLATMCTSTCSCGHNAKICGLFTVSQSNNYLEPSQVFGKTVWEALTWAERIQQVKIPFTGCRESSAHKDYDHGTMVKGFTKKLKEQRGISLKSVRSSRE
ncbi:uncharacterized protein PAC_13086 [Phialocephala subalpina]|uniref:BTB domain-containing protein n=1 Tax=Phialocephala subalpina TaxID=576137 RepID=A0A1L7XDR6_9HELO|nr:uncharacterized protein PAC_13086 [Phialocephala subalpina]